MNVKGSKVKKPKLSEEEKRNKVREALLKKKAFEDRALKIVEQLLEPGINADWFVEVSSMLTQSYYKDAVEERSLDKMCGYPLCDKEHRPETMKGQYKIDLKRKKVYNIAERKFFCSDQCFTASEYFHDQLDTSPLWLRETETPKFAKIWKPGTPTKKDRDNDTITTALLKELDRDIDITVQEESKEESKNVGAKFVSRGKNKLFKSVEDNVRERNSQDEEKEETSSTDKMVRFAKDFSEIRIEEKKNPGEEVTEFISSWFTIDSFRLVKGEEKLKEELRDHRVKEEMWASTLGDPDLGEQYQAKYRDLARRLDILELEDQMEEKAERLPMPSFEMLKQHLITENKKMESFMAGKTSYEIEDNIVETEVEQLEPRLPLLDHQAQMTLRRNIVMSKTADFLPEILKSLGLSMDQVRPGLRKLVSSFHLLPHTIMLPPHSWRLVILVLLRLLAEQDSTIDLRLKQSHVFLQSQLATFGLEEDYLDVMTETLGQDVVSLLAKYNIQYNS